MLTDSKLRSQVDALWDKLWAGGLSNPMDAIEQFSYLLFFKRLEEQERLPYEYDIAAIIARYERLWAQMSEAERQTELLFRSLLAQSFSEGLIQSFSG